MKMIDNDIKKMQDELQEHRNNYAQLSKKEGNNFLTQDISEPIYTKGNLNAADLFVEMKGSETFGTVIAIVHKTKIQGFLEKYERIIPWSDTGVFGAVPRSAKPLDLEDKDGN